MDSSSRAIPLGILPLNSPDQPLKTINSEDTTSENSERSALMNIEQNGMLDTVTVLIGSGERGTVGRSGAKYFSQNGIALENGKAEQDQDHVLQCYRPGKIYNHALLSGLAYCISSCSLILVNKLVLSGYNFNAGISLMLYQNFVSVTVVSTLSLFGIISTEPLTWKLVKIWLPVNVIFVGMLITSMFRL